MAKPSRPWAGLGISLWGYLLLTSPGCGEDAQPRCRYALDAKQIEGTTVVCDDLEVPGRWATTEGPGMKLHVAAFRADPEAFTPRAWMWLLGGPGQSWKGSTEALSPDAIEKIGQDLLIVDQRGVGFNSPKINCAEAGLPADASPAEAVRDCVKYLRDHDVPIEGYTTWDMARDIEAARIHFGYAALDLVGTSYGTRLALEYLRLYPNTSHAVALDSVWPPSYRLFETQLVARSEALEAVFVTCAEDPACQVEFPELEQTFEELYALLEESPVAVDGGSMDGDAFVSTLVATVLSFIPASTPAVIYETAQAVKVDHEIPPSVKELFGSFEVGLDEDGGNDLLIAVTCAENQGVSLETIQAQKAEVRPSLHALAEVVEDFLYPACQAWPEVPVPPDAFDPVRNTDVPVLMMSGRLDPRTPLSWAKDSIQSFGNRAHVILQHQGHSLLSQAEGCLLGYSLKFMFTGEAPEDFECDASLDPDFYTTVHDAVDTR